MLGKIEGKGEGDGRGWDETASPTQRTWIWTNSGRQWRTEEPGVLQSMGSQKVRHDLVTKQRQQNVRRWSWSSSTLGPPDPQPPLCRHHRMTEASLEGELCLGPASLAHVGHSNVPTERCSFWQHLGGSWYTYVQTEEWEGIRSQNDPQL